MHLSSLIPANDTRERERNYSIVKSSRYFRLYSILTVKSSAEIPGENNARCLLKSVQNPEISFNYMSVNMYDYFINTLCIKRKSYFKSILKISTQNFK